MRPSSEGRATIRLAQEGDLPGLGRLGALLVYQHHAFDPARFLAPDDGVEEGYAWFLGTQLQAPDVVIHVAQVEGEVVGYVYAAIEPPSWKELREQAGFIHDIVVDERFRRRGVGQQLLEAAVAWLEQRGAPQILLCTATANLPAQRLFARLGFRTTMLEMSRQAGTTKPPFPSNL
jgi:ribosomal protein S18 acetylase RimI-like enzyme